MARHIFRTRVMGKTNELPDPDLMDFLSALPMGSTTYDWFAEACGLPCSRTKRKYVSQQSRLLLGFTPFPEVDSHWIAAIDCVAVELSREPVGSVIPGGKASLDETVGQFAGVPSTRELSEVQLATQAMTVVIHPMTPMTATIPVAALPIRAEDLTMGGHLHLLREIVARTRDLPLGGLIVGDQGGGFLGLVNSFMKKNNFSKVFKIRDCKRLEHPCYPYGVPILDSRPLFLLFDPPHWARNIHRTFKSSRTLSLYENGPLISAAHIYEALLSCNQCGEATWRCFATNSERQDSDAAQKVLSSATAADLFKTLGQRSGATTLMLLSASRILGCFIGAERNDDLKLQEVFAGYFFFARWRQTCASSDNFITSEQFEGIKNAVSIAAAWASVYGGFQLPQGNTLLLEALFSFLRGGTGKLSATSSHLTMVDYIYRLRKYVLQERIAAKLHHQCDVSMPSKKSKATLDRMRRSISHCSSREIVDEAAMWKIAEDGFNTFTTWCHRYLESSDVQRFLPDSDFKTWLRTLAHDTAATVPQNQGAAVAEYNLEYLLKCFDPTLDSTLLDPDTTTPDSSSDIEKPDNIEEEKQGWNFLLPYRNSLVQPTVVNGAAKVNFARAQSKLPIRNEAAGNRDKRFYATKSSTPSAARCYCSSHLIMCPNENSNNIQVTFDELRSRHVALGGVLDGNFIIEKILVPSTTPKGKLVTHVRACISLSRLFPQESTIILFDRGAKKRVSMLISQLLCVTIQCRLSNPAVELSMLSCKCHKPPKSSFSPSLFVVEKFVNFFYIGDKSTGGRQLFWVVKWKGYNANDTTEENAANLQIDLGDDAQ